MIIARRVLTYCSDAGEVSIPIEISAPEQRELGWRCPYTIAWPHGTWASEGYGLDAVQALELTLQKIGIEIYVSEYHVSGRLRWEKPHSGYGFPVPHNARDMLVGDDVTWFG